MKVFAKIVGSLVIVYFLCFLIYSLYVVHGIDASLTATLLVPVCAVIVYHLFFKQSSEETVVMSEGAIVQRKRFELIQKENLIKYVEDMYREGKSCEYIASCLSAIKTLSKNKIRFVSLENAIKEIRDRKHNLVYLFLERPLNTKGVFFDYLCDLITRNTTVVMYTSEENVGEAIRIEEMLIGEVGEKAVSTYFEYPKKPNDTFLMVNCVIVDPRLETQRVYLAIRGIDGKSIVALELPPCSMTADIVERAEDILKVFPRIIRKIGKVNGGAV